MKLTIIWLALILITGITWAIGHAGIQAEWALPLLLITIGIKGYWIISDYMELRHVRPLWSSFIYGWLFLLIVLIYLLF